MNDDLKNETADQATGLRSRRSVLGLAAFSILSACGPKPLWRASPDQTLRVMSVDLSVRPEFRKWPVEIVSLPDERTGFTPDKIRADYSAALKSALIPTSRNGARKVAVKIEIIRMALWGIYFQQGRENYSITTALMDVTDTETGEVLVSQETVFVTELSPKGNSVAELVAEAERVRRIARLDRTLAVKRAYYEMLRRFPLEVRSRLRI